MLNLNRRKFIKASGAGIVVAASGIGIGMSGTAHAKTAMVNISGSAPLPKPNGPRIVVVGGGTAGLTIAKYLKKESSRLDVVLIERRDMYSSCFSSNLWYPGIIDLEFLAEHSFLDAAVNGGYTFFSGTVLGLDRDSKEVITDQGTIEYDFVVFAPGIDYHYPRYGIDDPAEQLALAQKYPGGFMKGTEHVTIKSKVDNFDGGVFLLNVPPGNYRCLPGPYERACMIASIFKKEKIKGKVLVIDANPDVTIKKDGFHAAFDELYKGILEYKPSVEITGVNLDKKEIKTEFDTIKFDDAAIYPFVRASRLIETCGLMNPKDSQFQANIDDERNNLIGDNSVYVTGDSRPMPFSKSANTAQTEAHYVAKVVAARAMGKDDPAYESPNTICFSMVNAYPPEAISVNAYYKKNESGAFGFDRVNMVQERSAAQASQTLEWGKGVYRDMFE